jgi:unsaturated rhamnogalacturonyl hydrolase
MGNWWTSVRTSGERLHRSAGLLVRYPFEFWHYGDSIGFEGLLAASELLGEPQYEGFVHGALRAWAARREPFRELDNTTPGHAICLTYERTGDEAILEGARALASFLASRRRVEGAFVSFERVPLRRPYSGEPLSSEEEALLDAPGAGVFVDCLHFDPPFFAHLGRLTGDDRLLELAVEQALAHLRLLQDESGLVWHFWLERTRERYGYGWARGQGWVLLGLLDVLQHVEHDEIRSAFLSLAEALASLQQPDGGWPSVAHDPASGHESSTAAFAAAGFAAGVERGLLPDAFRERARAAWEHVRVRVRDDGALAGVSAAVWASTRASHYPRVPTGFVVPWGQGALLLAANRLSEDVQRESPWRRSV